MVSIHSKKRTLFEHRSLWGVVECLGKQWTATLSRPQRGRCPDVTRSCQWVPIQRLNDMLNKYDGGSANVNACVLSYATSSRSSPRSSPSYQASSTPPMAGMGSLPFNGDNLGRIAWVLKLFAESIIFPLCRWGAWKDEGRSRRDFFQGSFLFIFTKIYIEMLMSKPLSPAYMRGFWEQTCPFLRHMILKRDLPLESSKHTLS